MPPYFCPYVCQILTDFKNSFTGTFCGKFAIKWSLIIPPLLNSVATLPCETLMSVKLAIAAVIVRACTATFRTLQKVQTKVAADDPYNSGL